VQYSQSVHASKMSHHDDNEALQHAYNSCLKDIESLQARIKQYQQQQNAEPNVLSNFLRSDQAYYPQANKEQNGSQNFQRRALLQGHFNKIYALSWSCNGSLASTGQDQKLIIWSGNDSNAGHKLCVITIADLSGMALSFSSKNGEYVACGGLDNECTVYKINYSESGAAEEKSSGFNVNATKLSTLQKHKGFISDCILINDATEMLTASGDAKMYLWDIENGVPTQEFHGHERDVLCIRECNVEYSQQFGDQKNNNKLVLSASSDRTCKLWDYRMHKMNNCVATYYAHDSDVNCCSWFPDGNAFASGSESGQIKLTDIRTHRVLNEYSSKSSSSKSSKLYPVQSLCFSKSGYFLFAGIDGGQFGYSWKTATGQQRAPLTHEQRVSAIKVSPQGNKIATGCWDFNIRLWA